MDNRRNASPNSGIRLGGQHVGPLIEASDDQTNSRACLSPNVEARASNCEPVFNLVRTASTSSDAFARKNPGVFLRTLEVGPVHSLSSDLAPAYGDFSSTNSNIFCASPHVTSNTSASADFANPRKHWRPPAVRRVHILNGNLETANGGFTSINSNNRFGPPHDATNIPASANFTNPQQHWTLEAGLGYEMNYDRSEKGNLTSTDCNNLGGLPHFTTNGSTSANFANPGTYQTPEAWPWYGLNDDPSMVNGNLASTNGINLCGLPHFTANGSTSANLTNPGMYRTPEAGPSYGLNDDPSMANGNLASTYGSNLCGPLHFTTNGSTSANFTNPGTYRTPEAGPWYGMNDDPSMANGNLASTNSSNLFGPPHFTTNGSTSANFTNPGMCWTPEAGPVNNMNNNLETANGNFTSTNSNNLYGPPHITTNNASSANFPNLFCQVKPLRLESTNFNVSASKNSRTSWGSSGVKLEHERSNNLAMGSETRSIYQEVDHQLKSQAVAEASTKTCSCVPEQSTDLAGNNLAMGSETRSIYQEVDHQLKLLQKLEHERSNNLAMGSETRSIYQEVDHQLKSQAVAEASTKTCSCVPQQSTDLAGKDVFSSLDIGSRLEEFRLVSLKMTREEATEADDIGYKTCNCKMSKCLKLYCECFAGTTFCLDSCACENCSNKDDYVEDVDKARNKLLAHNPLAFGPKVVSSDTLTDIKENGIRSTQNSTSHIKGCSCKNSKCRKRYCECFQNHVGCSSKCQCRSCQNSYGANTTVQSIVKRGKKRDKLSNDTNLANGIRSVHSKTANTNHFSPEGVPIEMPSNDEFRASSSVPSPSSTDIGYDPIISTAQCHLGDNSQPSESGLTLQLHGNGDSQHYSTAHDTPEAVGSSVPNEAVQAISQLGNNFQLLESDLTIQPNGNGDSLHCNITHDMPVTVGPSVPSEVVRDISPDSDVFGFLENIFSFED